MRRRARSAAVVGLVVVFAVVMTTVGMEVFGQSTSAAPLVTGLAIDPSDGSLIKVDRGLFRSTDRGATWAALPVPEEIRPDKLRVVATNAEAPATIYAAGPGAGVIRSDDAGQTWRDVSGDLPSSEIGALTVHTFRPNTLYAWIDKQGVFRTEDGGNAWTKMDDGPPQDGPRVPVVALAHSTLEGSMNTGWLYASTPDGPYLSMDCF